MVEGRIAGIEPAFPTPQIGVLPSKLYPPFIIRNVLHLFMLYLNSYNYVSILESSSNKKNKLIPVEYFVTKSNNFYDNKFNSYKLVDGLGSNIDLSRSRYYPLTDSLYSGVKEVGNPVYSDKKVFESLVNREYLQQVNLLNLRLSFFNNRVTKTKDLVVYTNLMGKPFLVRDSFNRNSFFLKYLYMQDRGSFKSYFSFLRNRVNLFINYESNKKVNNFVQAQLVKDLYRGFFLSRGCTKQIMPFIQYLMFGVFLEHYKTFSSGNVGFGSNKVLGVSGPSLIYFYFYISNQYKLFFFFILSAMVKQKSVELPLDSRTLWGSSHSRRLPQWPSMKIRSYIGLKSNK